MSRRRSWFPSGASAPRGSAWTRRDQRGLLGRRSAAAYRRPPRLGCAQRRPAPRTHADARRRHAARRDPGVVRAHACRRRHVVEDLEADVDACSDPTLRAAGRCAPARPAPFDAGRPGRRGAAGRAAYTTPELLAAEQRIVARASEPSTAPIADGGAVARPSQLAPAWRRSRSRWSGASRAIPAASRRRRQGGHRQDVRARRRARGVGGGAASRSSAPRWLGAPRASSRRAPGSPSTSLAALLDGPSSRRRVRPRRRGPSSWSTRRAWSRRVSWPSCSSTSPAADAKLVLVGDHHQLPAIQAGGAFRALARGLAPSSCTRTAARRRLGADALDLLREGRRRPRRSRRTPPRSPRRRRGRRRRAGRRSSATGGARWRDGRRGDDRLPSRRRRGSQRAGARELLRAGRLGDRQPRSWRAADSRSAIASCCGATTGASGSRTATAARGRSRSSQARASTSSSGRRVHLDAAYLSPDPCGAPALTHGYAITGHVAQGMTVDGRLCSAPTRCSRSGDTSRSAAADTQPLLRRRRLARA